MPPLDAKARADLPDAAFAYIDSRGRRRLPVHDEAHVRNALARFNQTVFEDEAGRERAREKVLKAAKRYGIVPVGFVTGQIRRQEREADAGRLILEFGRIGGSGELDERLRTVLDDPTVSVLHWSQAAGVYVDRAGKPAEPPDGTADRAITPVESDGTPIAALVHDPSVLKQRALLKTVVAALRLALENERLQAAVAAQADGARGLPGGVVTFLMTDVEGSTALLRRLGDRYAALIEEVRAIHRTALRHAGGREVDARADEFFAVFEHPTAALEAALAIQRALRDRAWPDALEVRVRIGAHTGETTLTNSGYVGLAVHTAARVCSAAHGGQVIVSGATREALGGPPPKAGLQRLGLYRLHGLSTPEELFQLEAADLPHSFPAVRAAAWSAAHDLFIGSSSWADTARAHSRLRSS